MGLASDSAVYGVRPPGAAEAVAWFAHQASLRARMVLVVAPMTFEQFGTCVYGVALHVELLEFYFADSGSTLESWVRESEADPAPVRLSTLCRCTAPGR